MIWFFIAGMITGAVGLYMFSGWYCKRHEKKIERRDRLAIAYMEDLRVNHPEFWKAMNTVPNGTINNNEEEKKDD